MNGPIRIGVLLFMLLKPCEIAAQTTMEWLFAVVAPAAGQTVRLNATLIGANPIVSPRDSNAPPVPIHLVFEVYALEKTTENPAVRKFGFSHTESATVMMKPGESASFEFSTGGDLTQIRPVVFADQSMLTKGVALLPSVEIRELDRLLFVAGLIEARKGGFR
ncbi:MAG TPA: hypothetical protein VGF40_00515 [Thermoanaerobaculia bacterium]